jgi:hypothetical protein
VVLEDRLPSVAVVHQVIGDKWHRDIQLSACASWRELGAV